MARSTTNKAKTKAKKTAPKAASPTASINAKAQLTAITTAAHSIKTGNYDTQPGTAMVITLKIPMGAPVNVPSWENFQQQRASWRRGDWIDRQLRKLKPPAPKVVKAKKGEAVKVETPLIDTVPAFDEKAARKRLGNEYDAETKVKYEAECNKANAANARFMERAAAFAMFAALRGQEVQLSLTPVQQGFSAMFGRQGTQAQLGTGEPPAFEAALDAADDLDDGDDGE